MGVEEKIRGSLPQTLHLLGELGRVILRLLSLVNEYNVFDAALYYGFWIFPLLVL